MDLKTGIFSLALGTLFLGSAARAEGPQQFQAPQYNGAQVQAQGFRGTPSQTYSWGHADYDHNRRDDRWYRHTPQPPAPYHQHGRYELKYVQQWVPGRYDQVWVPQDCSYRPRWGSPNCTGGYYNQQWVDGHYETVEQWVWVRA
jgi:hypothetical protein